MEYKILTEKARDKTIVEFFEAQERDLHSHTINKERYESMLPSLQPGKFRARIQELLEQTNDRLEEVSNIIKATIPQLPPDERIKAILAERDAAEK
jgi:hypothetical protein